MKVIKASDVPQSTTQVGEVDHSLVETLQQKFDTLKQLLDTKSYGVYLEADLTKFALETFYPNVEWKGYESYAVTETFDQLSALKQDNGSIQGQVRPEIVEAIFHFIKGYISKGTENARLFKRMADQFAITIQEINTDRQELKDVSLELVAAEKGITVQQLTGELQRDPNFLDK